MIDLLFDWIGLLCLIVGVDGVGCCDLVFVVLEVVCIFKV